MLVVMFQAGGQRFALEARAVEHVGAYAEPRPTPGAPPWYAGLLVFRGAPTPVIDLCQLLTGEPCPVRWSTRLLFVRLDGRDDGPLVGLLAERVTTGLVKDRGEGAPFQTPRGAVLLDEQGMFQLLDPGRLFQPEQTALLGRRPGDKS